ncbi:ABC transporter ATP-binding protein [Lacicoccus alkaliphilus]|uniref:Iron complex transport system ATP-binding protein n=1 Tax=Lacicoccus alkaliphilus DSM 16010 TaxID=1123231 RepID=A0A1M7K7R1_9BACL|nr:ABC transporter ATP-binding protein [Salinicoccus alkaliphilus]SHM61352.1 iron complex transport system ATP-binding protein [Salinicoccus alkaliphilus DSM 16010]
MTNVLEVEDVTVGYGKKAILKDFKMRIPKGRITSIVGPNGCGKTTLLHTLARAMKPKYGAVLIDGRDIFSLHTKDVAKRLSLLPQSSTAPAGLDVYDLVSYGRYPHKGAFEGLNQKDAENIEWAMEVTGIRSLGTRRLSELSGGQGQRVWLAMALAQNTDVILLDEPTTYLDMKFQMEILQLLKDLNTSAGKTIVMVLHDINHASRFSDCMIAMQSGGIISSGSPEAVMTENTVREVFDVTPVMGRCPFTQRPIIASYRLKG